MRSPGTRSMLAAFVAAAILAGCGESNSTTTPNMTTTTVAPEADATGYPAEADQLCAQVSAGFAEAQAETPRSFEQAEELMTALAEIVAEGEAALAAVTPPAEIEASYAKYLASRAEVVALIQDGLAAAQEADGEAYQLAMDAVKDGARERERLATAAGLSECAAGERG